ncbi:hypothetical protein QVD17_39174 [Tagetes erecta]|uniref:Agenet domain-containing protein n=1 Tax=Tagetes erecta TaxID=13708 RepID=A0AAD8JN29_TARER|nr:hypothetical protein QVD17_39174 [Tagetes erecta]
MGYEPIEASTMEKPDDFIFKVGELAEVKSFEKGYRGAWFRCEIKDIQLKQNKIYLKCYDFELEELSWEKIYDVPPNGRKSESQLMLRPQYPIIYSKSEMPPVHLISQPCVVTDGIWKVGDLVDWYKDSSYWSAMVVKVLKNNRVQIELPMPPLGEGKKGKKGKHEAFSKDLRPSLDWSITKGWTLRIVGNQTTCHTQLFFPTKQGVDFGIKHAEAEISAARGSPPRGSSAGGSPLTGMDLEAEHAAAAGVLQLTGMTLGVEHAAVGSPTRVSVAGRPPPRGSAAVSSPLRGSAAGSTPSGEAVAGASPPRGSAAGGSPVNASSTTRISAEGDRECQQTEKDVKTDCGVVESSESISSSHVKKRKAANDEVRNVIKRDLNIMHENTLDAAILDLEELINKVNWMKRLLKSPSHSTTSWKFVKK